MNDSNKDMTKVIVSFAAALISVAAAALGIDKANDDAKKAGREAPVDKIKKWFS